MNLQTNEWLYLLALLKECERIKAIKYVRDCTQSGLEEARDFVNEVQAVLPEKGPSVEPLQREIESLKTKLSACELARTELADIRDKLAIERNLARDDLIRFGHLAEKWRSLFIAAIEGNL